MQQVEVTLVGRLSRAEAAEEVPLQEILLARAACRPGFRCAARGALVLQQARVAFEDGDL
jgi:hypothetical protein